MLSSFVAAVVRASSAAAWLVAALAIALGAIAGVYAVSHFQIDTNSENLVSTNTPWRQNEIRYDRAFPQQNNFIEIVVDGATAERAGDAAAALTAALKRDREHFVSVRRPDGGPFFEREGLLLLPLGTVKKTTGALIGAQPFLAGLAADPSLRGVLNTLNTALLGAGAGQTTMASLDKPMTAFAATFSRVLQRKPAYFGGSAMVSGMGGLSRTRRFVEVQPKLDYAALLPGKKATGAIRAAAAKLGLNPASGVRVRLTGPVPLADEEFGSITENGELLATLMGAATLLMLWLAVRSARLIVAILATVFIGLATTAAIGLFIYGHFNVISVAFIVLFVGLGVDFGIQFCVRYRAERFHTGDLRSALPLAGAHIGTGLTLAALGAAAAFFSFLPTDYAGLAELGAIAGLGMIVTYILSITALPAFLRLLKPRAEAEDIGFHELAPVDAFLGDDCNRVLVVAAIVGIAGLAVIPLVNFDSNPLDLRNPHSESVSTALELMKNPETSPNAINVLRPSRESANGLAARLSKLSSVSHALTVDSFIPDKQTEKLAVIRDATNLLDTAFHPFVVAPPPSDAELIATLRKTAASLRSAAGGAKNAAAGHAMALARILDRLAQGSPALRARAAKAFVPGLKTMLNQLRTALHPAPVTFQSLPKDMVRDWVSPDGLYRVQAVPTVKANEGKGLHFFTHSVLAAAPGATGTPIIVMESASTIVWAFIEAGAISFASIAIILVLALRRFGDELMALLPLVFALVMTLATCVAFGIQLNFANIIALPLLFGVGVAFDIYFVMAWREGRRNLLQSSLTRAILMSAGTTGAAFGTLSISSHPGTASMGQLLLIALFWILVSMLILLPALLCRVLPNEGLRSETAAG